VTFDLNEARQHITAAFPVVDAHPDVAGVFRQPHLLRLVGQALAHPYRDRGVTAVVAPEARGPIVGALVAVELGAGLVLARKDGSNHPGADLRIESAPTWRGTTEVFQTRSFDLDATDRVVIVDDWITTGSSIRATAALVDRCGATLVGVAAIVDKAEPTTIAELDVHTLVDFAAIGPAPH
jgi:adenine phosphoribosyltransferase